MCLELPLRFPTHEQSYDPAHPELLRSRAVDSMDAQEDSGSGGAGVVDALANGTDGGRDVGVPVIICDADKQQRPPGVFYAQTVEGNGQGEGGDADCHIQAAPALEVPIVGSTRPVNNRAKGSHRGKGASAVFPPLPAGLINPVPAWNEEASNKHVSPDGLLLSRPNSSFLAGSTGTAVHLDTINHEISGGALASSSIAGTDPATAENDCGEMSGGAPGSAPTGFFTLGTMEGSGVANDGVGGKGRDLEGKARGRRRRKGGGAKGQGEGRGRGIGRGKGAVNNEVMAFLRMNQQLALFGMAVPIPQGLLQGKGTGMLHGRGGRGASKGGKGRGHGEAAGKDSAKGKTRSRAGKGRGKGGKGKRGMGVRRRPRPRLELVNDFVTFRLARDRILFFDREGNFWQVDYLPVDPASPVRIDVAGLLPSEPEVVEEAAQTLSAEVGAKVYEGAGASIAEHRGEEEGKEELEEQDEEEEAAEEVFGEEGEGGDSEDDDQDGEGGEEEGVEHEGGEGAAQQEGEHEQEDSECEEELDDAGMDGGNHISMEGIRMADNESEGAWQNFKEASRLNEEKEQGVLGRGGDANIAPILGR